jgi:hypothetical protein
MSGRVRWQMRREFDTQLAAFVDALLPAMTDLFAVLARLTKPEIPAADAAALFAQKTGLLIRQHASNGALPPTP